MTNTLIYVHDPMCSWCWGFTSVYHQLVEQMPDNIELRRLVGGLAPDSDQPMPQPMQQMLQQTWQRIEQTIPGTRFNYDFWSQAKPRRSTYPACRAVIAARGQGETYDLLMTSQIQQAYYLQARNPSDNSTLIELSAEIGLDAEQFSRDLVDPKIDESLVEEINYTRSIGIDSFPSLMLDQGGHYTRILTNYNDVNPILEQINARI